MGNWLKLARSAAALDQNARHSCSKGGIYKLPPEVILLILETDILSVKDRLGFALTCKRFEEITLPTLYMSYDWVAPLQTPKPPLWYSLAETAAAIVREPWRITQVGIFAEDDWVTKKHAAFVKHASRVREMSALLGYFYCKKSDALSRYYGPKSHSQQRQFIELLQPFDNLVTVEVDDRAAISWFGYLQIVSYLVKNKPKLKDLTLRHRLARPGEGLVYMGPLRETLAQPTVAKLERLSIIFGRRFEASGTKSEFVSQLMEVLEGATEEVRDFKFIAIFSHFFEYIQYPHAQQNICLTDPTRKWSLPKLQALQYHTIQFPNNMIAQSIRSIDLRRVQRLQFICNLSHVDTAECIENLRDFVSLRKLRICDQRTNCQSDDLITIPNIFQGLSAIKDTLTKLEDICYVVRSEEGIIKYSLSFSDDKVIPYVFKKTVLEEWTPEDIKEYLPTKIGHIKEGYMW